MKIAVTQCNTSCFSGNFVRVNLFSNYMLNTKK